jgi:hypothetical protein
MRINAAIRLFVYVVFSGCRFESARLNPFILIVLGTERFVAPSFSNVQIDHNRMQKQSRRVGMVRLRPERSAVESRLEKNPRRGQTRG